MYQLEQTGKFKKNSKLAKKRGLDMRLLDEVVTKTYYINKNRYTQRFILRLAITAKKNPRILKITVFVTIIPLRDRTHKQIQ